MFILRVHFDAILMTLFLQILLVNILSPTLSPGLPSGDLGVEIVRVAWHGVVGAVVQVNRSLTYVKLFMGSWGGSVLALVGRLGKEHRLVG